MVKACGEVQLILGEKYKKTRAITGYRGDRTRMKWGICIPMHIYIFILFSFHFIFLFFFRFLK